jgi:hypothetical protein
MSPVKAKVMGWLEVTSAIAGAGVAVGAASGGFSPGFWTNFCTGAQPVRMKRPVETHSRVLFEDMGGILTIKED